MGSHADLLDLVFSPVLVQFLWSMFMGTVCAKRKCARKIGAFPYDVCVYIIMDPIKPTNWNPSKDCSFLLKIPCACHNVVFFIECYVLSVHFRLVIKYIYFTTIFKNGWMENKEISFFFIRLWFIVELCYCYSWKGTRPCYIQWWSSFSLCILFNYIASLTGTDLWWL